MEQHGENVYWVFRLGWVVEHRYNNCNCKWFVSKSSENSQTESGTKQGKVVRNIEVRMIV